MKLILPLPPNRANSRWHWTTEKRIKDDYMMRCTIAHGTHRPRQPMERVTIRAGLFVHQTMDQDNLMARLKWPVDWLVERMYIADDKPSVLEWMLPTQAIDRKNQRIEIELEEIIEESPPDEGA